MRWLVVLLASGGVSIASAESIVGARYTEPVDRYGHFALGRPHEYGRVVVSTDRGHDLVFVLPQDEVFEDLAPRLVSLGAGDPVEILAVVSHRQDGSRLVLIGLREGRLEINAESAAIGLPRRWLNPVGVADLDGDGHAEIAAVTTPHIGGTLRVYRRSAKRLVETAALADFSNHVFGSSELGLSVSLALGGRMRLLVPDAARRALRVVGMEAGRLTELARCPLPATVSGAIEVVSPTEVSLKLAGTQASVRCDSGFPIKIRVSGHSHTQGTANE